MSEKPQAQRKQTAAEVAEQLRASMHADRQLITNAQQEAKEDARRIDRRVDALVIELTELQKNHADLSTQVKKKAAELAAAEARIQQEARTLAESWLHHGERIAQMEHRVDQVAKNCDQAEQQAAKALSLQDDLPTIRSQLRQAIGKLSELEYVAKLRPLQNARRLVAEEIRHVASSAERHIKRFADRLESDIPF